MSGGSGGGGGGGGWPRWSRGGAHVERTVADTTAKSDYEARANAYLQDLLASHNDRDVGPIQTHLDTLKQAVEQDVEGEITTRFGGSVRKHTYVDGLSDVDVLVVVNESSLADASPQAVLQHFERSIKARLPDTDVKAGSLAVTVKFTDGTELQLLPALRTATGVRVASADGSGWSSVARPDQFAKKLTEVNQACGRKVVPVVKLFKGLQASFPATNQLTGYHVESLAIEAFKNYSERLTDKDMLLHFVRSAAERVRAPVNDTTGQSLHVDDYLGAAASANRVRISNALERLASRLATADGRASLDNLRSIFGE